jgi:hypothetical protein
VVERALNARLQNYHSIPPQALKIVDCLG